MKISMLQRMLDGDRIVKAIDFFGNGQVICYRGPEDYKYAANEPSYRLFGDIDALCGDHYPKAFSVPYEWHAEAFWADFCETAGNSTIVEGEGMDGRHLLTIGTIEDLAILRMML